MTRHNKPMVRIATFRAPGYVLFVIQGNKKALDMTESIFDKYGKKAPYRPPTKKASA